MSDLIERIDHDIDGCDDEVCDSCDLLRDCRAEIERLQEHNLKLMDVNVRLSDKVIHLKKECEDKDRVIRAGISTAKRLRAALERIAHNHYMSEVYQFIAKEALGDD